MSKTSNSPRTKKEQERSFQFKRTRKVLQRTSHFQSDCKMGNEVSIANDGITVTNGLLKVGTSLVNEKELYKGVLSKIGTLVACGELVNIVLSLVLAGQPNPVIEKLKELERKIDQLGEKITRQFDELKAFVVEHHFYAEIAQTASTLTKFLQDTMSKPSHDSIGHFEAISKKHPPLEIAYKMLSLLEQEVTNPLKMAMKADKLKTQATFDKWRDIINDILSQFLYLECMVSGMFYNKNRYGPDQLAQRIADFNGQMEKWRKEYKRSYWPEAIETLVHDTQDNYEHVGNLEKAERLRDEMGKILTDDAFYIIVYNDCGGYEKHCFTYFKDQFFESFRRGKCNVVIYRSLEMNDGSEQTTEDLDKMESEVESCRRDVPRSLKQREDFPYHLWENRISNAGFVGMIKNGQKAAVLSVNSWREWGPGWWIKTESRSSPSYWLIAGYK